MRDGHCASSVACGRFALLARPTAELTPVPAVWAMSTDLSIHSRSDSTSPHDSIGQRGFAASMYALNELVELSPGEVHQRVTEQLDADAIGIAQVHRLWNAAIGTDVRNTGLIKTGLQSFPGRSLD